MKTWHVAHEHKPPQIASTLRGSARMFSMMDKPGRASTSTSRPSLSVTTSLTMKLGSRRFATGRDYNKTVRRGRGSSVQRELYGSNPPSPPALALQGRMFCGLVRGYRLSRADFLPVRRASALAPLRACFDAGSAPRTTGTFCVGSSARSLLSSRFSRTDVLSITSRAQRQTLRPRVSTSTLPTGCVAGSGAAARLFDVLVVHSAHILSNER